MSGLSLPDDPAQQNAILRPLGKPEAYAEGTPERVFASYKRYLAEKPTPRYRNFQDWLSSAYIRNAGNRLRGAAFHRKVVQDLRLFGPDWLCEATVKGLDEKGIPYTRRYDALHRLVLLGLEFKSGGTYSSTQADADRAALVEGKVKEVGVVLAQRPTAGSKTNIDRVGKGLAPRSIWAYQYTTTAIETFVPGPYTKKGDDALHFGRSPDVIERSGETPADMAEQLANDSAEDPEGQRTRGPGGVDFSTLELRYVGMPVKGKGLNYSFSAKQVDESAGLGYGGKEKAELISDSFFTWLALTPDKFWVNLNPDQPDRVMDSQLGATDAGRVLLQADLQMKHDFARDMDPRVGIGKKLTNMLIAEKIPCIHSVRNWIVPRAAEPGSTDESWSVFRA